MAETEKKQTPVNARQAFMGRRMLLVLGVSLALAVAAAVFGYGYIIAENDGDLAAPIPEANEADAARPAD